MKVAMFVFPICILIILFSLASCAKPERPFDTTSYQQEMEQWKATRLTRLKRDDGWLTLCGLFWLKEGENKVGSDSSISVVLPAGKAPKIVGSIFLDKNTLRFEARKGVEVKYKDSAVTAINLQSDEQGDPTILRHGVVSFYVIKRGDDLAVRVKDNENPARMNFKGLEYFPVDPKWRFEALFEPYHPPKILEIPDAVGKIERDSCPGVLSFVYDGKKCSIDVVVEQGSENQFFIMLGDETNGKETYAVGRQLYTNLPDSTNHVVLDFNKAYNWPCVFTAFATCPIPPKQNRLPFRVEAGEKMYSGH